MGCWVPTGRAGVPELSFVSSPRPTFLLVLLLPTTLLSEPIASLHEAPPAAREHQEPFPSLSAGLGKLLSSKGLLGQARPRALLLSLGCQSCPSAPAQARPQRFHAGGEAAQSLPLHRERNQGRQGGRETNPAAPGRCHGWFSSSKWAVTAAPWGREQGEQGRFMAPGQAQAEPSLLPSISFMDKMKCRTSSAGAL